MLHVFEVGEITEVSDGQWLVRGRALETIKVGDTVYSAVGRIYRLLHNDDGTLVYNDDGTLADEIIETVSPIVLRPFVVLTLSTYKREIDTLYRGLTGDLVVKGEDGDALKSTQLLVRR